MTPETVKVLEETALRVRQRILKMSTGGGCFTGASLSLADIVTFLYCEHLNVPSPTSEERDFVFLSKGHDVPALYGIFAELGWMSDTRLEKHLSVDDDLYWHPNRNVPGVEFHSGSLGHLLSVAMGVAYDLRLRHLSNQVYVILGDGELNEGSVWEALLVASSLKLSNLTIIVDRNEFQANVRTEELIPLEPLDAKFRAFGVHVQTTDGHDFMSLHETFLSLSAFSSGPKAVIAQTVRGKGVPSIESRADRWFCNFSDSEIAGLLTELNGGGRAGIESDGICVR